MRVTEGKAGKGGRSLKRYNFCFSMNDTSVTCLLEMLKEQAEGFDIFHNRLKTPPSINQPCTYLKDIE